MPGKRIAAMIDRELHKNPQVKSAELQEKAAKIDKKIADLSGRQFHARFTIQARKRLGTSQATKKVTRKKATRRKATPVRRRARVSSPGSSKSPTVLLLSSAYHEKRSALNDAIDQAFQRAVDADRLSEVNQLLEAIDSQIETFGRG